MTTRILVLLLTFSSALASAQLAGNTPSATSKALTALEQKWVAALTKRDVATLDSVLDATYFDTDERGQRSGKQQVLDAIRSGDIKLQSIKLSDMRIHDYGNAAVVNGLAEQVEVVKGKPVRSYIVFTDTFVRQKDVWKAVASHRSQQKVFGKGEIPD